MFLSSLRCDDCGKFVFPWNKEHGRCSECYRAFTNNNRRICEQQYPNTNSHKTVANSTKTKSPTVINTTYTDNVNSPFHPLNPLSNPLYLDSLDNFSDDSYSCPHHHSHDNTNTTPDSPISDNSSYDSNSSNSNSSYDSDSSYSSGSSYDSSSSDCGGSSCD